MNGRSQKQIGDPLASTTLGRLLKQADVRLLFALLVVLCMTMMLPDAFAEDKVQEGSDIAVDLFLQKCSGCHTVGKGNLVGPDLQVVSSWKASEIEANVKRMEKFVGPLNDDDIKPLVELLKDPNVQKRMEAKEKHVSATQTNESPASVEVGRSLFCGKERFINGGPSCISCHRTEGHGGTMGKDLTDVFSAMGESALVSACQQPNFPVMKKIFSERPLTKQEALHLTKYFASLKESNQSQQDAPVTELGVIGAIALLGGIMAFYRNRNTGVRSRLKRR